jgi:hypothetical protein
VTIDSEGWEVIEKHVGYGPKNAKVIFLGMEEGGPPEPEKLMKDLIDRSKRAPFCEISPSKTIVRTWRGMSDFMLRRDGSKNPTRESRREYQNQSLGKFHGDSLVMELMPYPAPNVKDWPYAERDACREAYLKRLRPIRTKLLKEVIALAEREFIICYGKTYTKYFEELFPSNLKWTPDENFLTARWNDQHIAIIPHFCSRQLNSDDQLAALFSALSAPDQ